MKYLTTLNGPIGEESLSTVIAKKTTIMTTQTFSLLGKKRNNSYLFYFERALHNLQLWQEEQREKRIQKHRKKQTQ